MNSALILLVIAVGTGWLGWRTRRVWSRRIASSPQGATCRLTIFQELRLLLFHRLGRYGIPKELLGSPERAIELWGRDRAVGAWTRITEQTYRRDKSVEGYPPDWEWRRMLAREHDAQLCDQCGWADRRAILHVHHKYPVGMGGDHRLSNLVTLCAECHAYEHSLIDRGALGRYFPKRRPWERR